MNFTVGKPVPYEPYTESQESQGFTVGKAVPYDPFIDDFQGQQDEYPSSFELFVEGLEQGMHDERGARLKFDDLLHGSTPERDEQIAELERTRPEQRNIPWRGHIPEKAAYETGVAAPILMRGAGEGVKGGVKGYMAGAGAAAAITAAGGTVSAGPISVAAAKAWGMVDAAKYMYKIEAGLAWYEFKEIEGVDQRIAKAGAHAVGAVNAALEMTQVGVIARSIPGGKKFISKAVSNGVVKKAITSKWLNKFIRPKTLKGKIAKGAGTYTALLGSNVAEEVAQEATKELGGNVIKILNNTVHDTEIPLKSWKEIKGVLGQTMEQAFWGFSVIAGIGPGMTVARDVGVAAKEKIKEKPLPNDEIGQAYEGFAKENPKLAKMIKAEFLDKPVDKVVQPTEEVIQKPVPKPTKEAIEAPKKEVEGEVVEAVAKEPWEMTTDEIDNMAFELGGKGYEEDRIVKIIFGEVEKPSKRDDPIMSAHLDSVINAIDRDEKVPAKVQENFKEAIEEFKIGKLANETIARYEGKAKTAKAKQLLSDLEMAEYYDEVKRISDELAIIFGDKKVKKHKPKVAIKAKSGKVFVGKEGETHRQLYDRFSKELKEEDIRSIADGWLVNGIYYERYLDAPETRDIPITSSDDFASKEAIEAPKKEVEGEVVEAVAKEPDVEIPDIARLGYNNQIVQDLKEKHGLSNDAIGQIKKAQREGVPITIEEAKIRGQEITEKRNREREKHFSREEIEKRKVESLAKAKEMPTKVSVVEYEVETEDVGSIDVGLERLSDGSVVVFDRSGKGHPVDYKPGFAKDKTDEDILKYQFEPAGFTGATKKELATAQPEKLKPVSKEVAKKPEKALSPSKEKEFLKKHAKKVQDIVSSVTAGWWVVPKIEVIQTEEEIPESIKKILKQKGLKRVKGYLHKGIITIVAENVKDEKDVVSTIAHELFGHYGIKKYLGKKYAEFMDKVYSSNVDRVKVIASAYKLNIENIHERRKATEEWLAREASKNPESTWVQKAIAMVREYLRTIRPNLSFNDAEIVQFLVDVRGFVEKGKRRKLTTKDEAATAFKLLKKAGAEHMGISDSELQELSEMGDQVSSLRFSKTKAEKPLNTKDKVEAEIFPVIKKWKNSPVIRVYQSVSELKKRYQKSIELKSKRGEIVEGFYDPETKEVILIADNLSPGRLWVVMAHEVFGHYGLRQSIPGYKKFLNDLAVAKKTELLKANPDLNFKDRETRMRAADEWFARQAEKNQVPATLWQKFVRLFREWVRKTGLNLKLTDSEIKAVLTGAKDAVENGLRTNLDEGLAYPRFQTTAWQGGPHDITKSPEGRHADKYIGSGEGAMAFGYGHYFSGAEEIGRFYADQLSNKGIVTASVTGLPVYTNGVPVDYSPLKTGEHVAALQEALLINEWVFKVENKKETLKEIQDIFDVEIGDATSGLENDKKYYSEKLKTLKKYRPNTVSDIGVKIKTNRNLYKVTLHKGKKPGSYVWLDWDLPVSDRDAASIIQQLKQEGVSSEELNEMEDALGLSEDYMGQAGTGESIYEVLKYYMSKEQTDKEASLFLLRAGIDGIRYPAGSLSGMKDTGAKNYVVFDPEAITIDEHIQYSKIAQRWFSKMTNFLASKKGLPIRSTPKTMVDMIKAFAKKSQYKQEELTWSGVIPWLQSLKEEDQARPIRKTTDNVKKEDPYSHIYTFKDGIRIGASSESEAITGYNYEKHGPNWEPPLSPEKILINGRVTKQKVLDYLKDNNIVIEEVVKGDEAERQLKGETTTKFAEPSYNVPGGKDYTELLLRMPVQKRVPTLNEYIRYIEGDPKWVKQNKPEKYKEHTEDYNHYVKVGSFPLGAYDSAGIDKRGYKGPHWDETGVLVHVRFDTRTGPKGEKILFLQEIQSDWQSDIRKKGASRESLTSAKLKYKEVLRQEQALLDNPDTPDSEFDRFEIDVRRPARDAVKTAEVGIPPAPWQKTYYLKAMQRMVRYAAENGFDSIAWTPGEVQAKRWGSQLIAWEKGEFLPVEAEKYQISKLTEKQSAVIAKAFYRAKTGLQEFINARYSGKFNWYLQDIASEDDYRKEIINIAEKKGIEIKDTLKTGWKVLVREQEAGGEIAGVEDRLRKEVYKTGDVITTKAELKETIRRISGWEHQYSKANFEAMLNARTDKTWDRMQKEDKGYSLPRKEAFESIYDKKLVNDVNKFFNKASWGKAKVGKVDIVSDTNLDSGELPYRINDPQGNPFDWFRTREQAEQTLEDLNETEQGYTLQANLVSSDGVAEYPDDTIKSWSLPITDQMKEKALYEGMPLFSKRDKTKVKKKTKAEQEFEDTLLGREGPLFSTQPTKVKDAIGKDADDIYKDFKKEFLEAKQPVKPEKDLKSDDIFKNLPDDVQEVRKEIWDNKGLDKTKPDLKTRIVETSKEALHLFQRSYKHLNPKKYGELLNIFRLQQEVPAYSRGLAMDIIKDIVKDLKPVQYEVFTMKLILDDMIKDVESGLLRDEGPLPFGFKNADQAKAFLKLIDSIVAKSDVIKSALSKRESINDRLKKALVANGILDKSVLDDPRYFHHQVMIYRTLSKDDQFALKTGTSQSLKMRKKGWQKARKGSIKAYNTEYAQSEFEVLAQGIAQLKTKKYIERIRNEVDISQILHKEAETKIIGMAQDGVAKSTKDKKLTAKKLRSLVKKRIREIKKDTGWNVRKIPIPAGYTEWVPEKGGVWYRTNSITDMLIDEVLRGAGEESQIEELEKKYIQGRWIIPNEVAKSLDEFGKYERASNVLSEISRKIQTKWKQWILINPMRVFKYNFNNMSGDLDIALSYDPKILKYFYKAMKDSFKNWYKMKMPTELRHELNTAKEKGVLGSGWSIQELTDVTTHLGYDKAVAALSGGSPSMVDKFTLGPARRKIWSGLQGFTEFRENILRLAAYRYFKDKIAKGEKDLYAASRRTEIDQLKNDDDRAAKLSRDLIGDYGNISEGGQMLRRHLIPFWSWMEVNAPRYVRLFKNLPHEGRNRKARFSGVIAWKGSKLVTKALILFAMVNVWNRLFFSDEEDELSESQRRQLHIILGRNDDNSIRSIRFQGALSDTLSWFGGEDIIGDIDDVVHGRKTVGQWGKEAVLATPTKFISGLRPEAKLLMEKLSGQSYYPDPFKPRPIRDMYEHFSRVVSADVFYRVIAGKPRRGDTKSKRLINDFLRMGIYTSDPGESAYYDIRSRGYEFMDRHGIEPYSGGRPTKLSNAQYYYRQALKYGDIEAAKRYMDSYLELGGKLKNLKGGIKRAHPTAGVKPKALREKFERSLKGKEKESLKRAEDWWRRTYQEGHERIHRPVARKRPKNK